MTQTGASAQALPGASDVPADAALAALWGMPFAVALLDEALRLERINPFFEQLLGEAGAGRLMGQSICMLWPPAERALREVELRAAGAVPSGEQHAPLLPLRLADAAGRERWLAMALRKLPAPAGAPADGHWLAMAQDTSQESQAREQVRRGHDELDQWFDLAGAGMLVYDDSGLIVRSNAAFEAQVERVPEVLAEAAPELRELLGWAEGRPHPLLVPGAPVLVRQVLLPLADGRRRRLVARLARMARVAPPAGGMAHAAARVMAVVEDRSAEDERDRARHEMGVLMSTASVSVATYDPGSGWLEPRTSPHAGVAAGVAAGGTTAGALEGGAAKPPREEPDVLPTRSALHHVSRESVLPDSWPEYERLQRALREGRRAEVRYAVQAPELGVRWLLTRVEPRWLAAGQRTISVVTLDVTEQQLAERRNAQLLRELTTILDSSTAGIAYLRGELLVRCNRRFERMLGVEPGTAAGRRLADILAPQGVPGSVLSEAAQVLEQGRTYDTELELAAAPPSEGAAAGEGGAADAGPRWVALSVRRAQALGAAADAGAETVAVLTDITRLKAQQAELERALRDRELVFNLAEVGMVVQRGARFVRANQAMAQLTGYAVPELGTLDPAELYQDARACVDFEARVTSALRSAGRFAGERQLRRRDGSLRWVQVAVRTLEADPAAEGAPATHTLVSFVDVDERHRAREAQAAQAERLRAVLNSVLVGIVTVGEQGIEWMNRSARRMFAGELADFIGEPLATVATPEPNHPLRRTDWWQRVSSGGVDTFECQLRGRDGREFWVVGNVVASALEGGPPQLTFALLDIERRRQAEVSIARTQASLQRLIETAPLAIALFDARRGRLLQLNRTASTLFGLDDAGAGQERALLALPNLPNRELGTSLVQWIAAVAPGEASIHEWRDAAGPAWPGRDSQEPPPLRVWDCRLAAVGAPLEDDGEGTEHVDPAAANPQVAHVMLLASDVTEQRAVNEARLREAIAQREVLVREVHHRIKNNLQGVAGLLKQNAARRPEVAPQLIEAVSQVQAIAQVYGLQVGGSAGPGGPGGEGPAGGAQGGPLAVARLVNSIAQSVARTLGRPIDVQLDEVPHLLPEAEAIPLALILNELFGNAIKHGHDACALCEVHSDGDAVQIRVSGGGRLPEGFDLAAVPAGVSGLGLVRALLPRRGATLSLSHQFPPAGGPAGAGERVVATLRLQAPSVRMPEPAARRPGERGQGRAAPLASPAAHEAALAQTDSPSNMSR